MKNYHKPAIRVCIILFIALSCNLNLIAQCPELTDNTLTGGCFNGTTPCDLCPGEVITLGAEGNNLIDGGCVDWYYSDDPSFNPYDGEGTFIACGEINSTFPPPCTVCPKLLAIYVDACGSEANNEYMLLSSGSGFNLNNLQVDLATQNNTGGAQNSDINMGPTPCSWKTPETILMNNLMASLNCDASNIIPVGPGGSIPANAIVAVFTSSGENVLYSFDNLCMAGYDIYVVQSACPRSIGAFTNGSGSGLRTQGILVSGCGCSDYLDYICEDLAPAADGDYVLEDGSDGTSPCTAPDVMPDIIAGVSTVEDVTLEMTEAMCNEGPYYIIGILDPAGPGACAEEFTPNLFSFNVVCPEAIADVDGPVCFGGNVTLTAEGGATYKWSGPGGFSSMMQNPVVSGLNASKSGLYYVTVTNTAGCTDVASVQLTVNPDITVSITPATPSICEGETVTLTGNATGGSGNFEYDWIDPLGGSSSGQNIDAGVGGIYTLIVTDQEGCTKQKTINVSTLPSPIVDISPQNLTLCEGGTATLTANASNGTPAYLYEWATGEGSKSISISSPGTFEVTVTDSKGCKGTAEIIVDEGESPEININPDPAIFCPGSNVSITATGSQGQSPYIYKWTTPAGIQNSQTIIAAVAGTYTVTITDDAGCTGIEDIEVSENPDITITISPDPASFCNGGSTNLTATTTGGSGSGYQFEWSTPGGPASGAMITALDPGIYSVVVTDGENCSATKSINVTQTLALNVGINPSPASFCPGSSVDLTANATGGSGGYNYNWTTPAGSKTGQIISATVVGDYTVTITDNNGCTGTKTINVTQDANIPVNITPDPASFCAGSNVVLTANTSAGGTLTYNWSTPSGPKTGNPLTASVAGDYTVTVTNSNGCSGTDTVSVSQDNNLPVGISPDPASFCPGGNVVLTASSSAGGTLTYQWSTPSGPKSGNTIPASVVGNYSVTVSNAGGCSGTTNINVTETTLISVTITPQKPAICAGSSIDISANAGSSGTLDYKWTTPGGPASGQTIKATFAGEYIVTVTDAGGCTGTATVQVDEFPGLDIFIDPNPASFCTNGSVTITAQNNNGVSPLSYSWTTPLGSGSNQTFDANVIGNYTVLVTDANGCTGSASTTVSQSNSLTLNFKPIPPGFCPGKTIDLSITANGGQAPFNYNWTSPIGNFTSDSINTGTAGSYKVTVTDVNGCSGLGEVIVDELEAPVLNLPSSAGFCNGKDIQINASATGGFMPFIYNWNTPIGSQSTSSFIGTKGGNYNVTVTNAAGCSTTGAEVVTEWPRPVLLYLPDSVQFCFGKSVNLSLNTATGTAPFNYEWKWPGGTFNGKQFDINTEGTYTIILTDSKACADTAIIKASLSPGLNVTLNTDPVLLCGVAQFDITSQTVGGNQPYSYTWNGPSGNNNTPVLSASSTGNYLITVTDVSGCTGSNSINVVNEPLSIEIDKTDPGCKDKKGGEISLLSAVNPGYPLSININNGPSQTITSLPFELKGLSAGTYDLVVTSSGGCEYKESIELSQSDLLNFSLGEDITIYLGETATINPIANFTIDSITWTNLNSLICEPGCFNPIAAPIVNTTYKATAFDDQGCSAKDDINVYIQVKQSVFVPNTFSPDANGINDTWVIYTDETVKQIKKLYVYDRWGESLFIQENFPPNDPDFGWNGKFRGSKMNTGVYVYYFEAEYKNGQTVIYKGDINILR